MVAQSATYSDSVAAPEGLLAEFIGAARDLLGDEWVHLESVKLQRFGEHTLAGQDRRPAAVVQPGSSADVVALVKLARRFKVPLHPISSGHNVGLGTRSAPTPGQVVVDMARRMNRIVEVNETLGYAVIEPGVTYQMLHDELRSRGSELMIDCTSGPPHGSMLGNAMDRGAGYTPYGDHFGNLCGIEIVLGTGETIRTGDASLANSRMWARLEVQLRPRAGFTVHPVEFWNRHPRRHLAHAPTASRALVPFQLSRGLGLRHGDRHDPAAEIVQLRADPDPAGQ